MMSQTVICVTGGIGSGKSVVCRICALRNIPVYDCDSKAKELMVTDPDLRSTLIDEIGKDIYSSEGTLNRKLLADKIFTDKQIRLIVEKHVHQAVRDDIKHWLQLNTNSPVAIIETAIPNKSGIDKMADSIWLVQAPHDVRVKRVQQRSNLTHGQITDRMAAQHAEFEMLPKDKTKHIDNSGSTPLLPQIDSLLSLNNLKL